MITRSHAHTCTHSEFLPPECVCVCVFFSRKLRLCSLLIKGLKALIIVRFYYVSFLSLKENDTHAISEAHGWINLFAQRQKKCWAPFIKPLISPDNRRVCRVVVVFFLNEVVQGRDLETGGVGPLGNQKVVWDINVKALGNWLKIQHVIMIWIMDRTPASVNMH